jgi:Tfp pilus assembly protein PilV
MKLIKRFFQRSRGKRRSQRQLGQTIVEVLIATAVVGTVLTAVAGALTFSVKNTAQARYRALAASQAQDAVEVFRRERALLGWESFQAEINPGVYCYNTLPTNSTQFFAVTPGACGSGLPTDSY